MNIFYNTIYYLNSQDVKKIFMTDCIYEEHRKDNDEKSKGGEERTFFRCEERKITCSFFDEIWLK